MSLTFGPSRFGAVDWRYLGKRTFSEQTRYYTLGGMNDDGEGAIILRERLSELLAAAGSAMERASGDASTCSFTKAGISVPTLKYAEGRWAALRELKSGGVDRDTAEDLCADWRRHLAALEVRGAGADWIAYRRGGVDALEEFLS